MTSPTCTRTRARRCRRRERRRAAVLGEFGGLGLPLERHTWLDRGNWGYRSFTTLPDLNAAYRDLLAQLRLHAGDGLTSAIYTQTTDVEIEVNGVLTYDRAVTKLDADSIAANRRMFDAPPRIVHLEPASDRQRQRWRFTTLAPANGWFERGFDDRGWRSGIREASARPPPASPTSAPSGGRATSGCGGR